MPGFNEKPAKTKFESAPALDELWLAPEVCEPLNAIPAYIMDGDLKAAKDAVERVKANIDKLKNEADKSRVLLQVGEYEREMGESDGK
jgi:hypothetical protein